MSVMNASAKDDYEVKRQQMVADVQQMMAMTESFTGEESLDKRVVEAMMAVPRHKFVPPGNQSYAYENTALPISHRQTISQPYMVALMTQSLQLKGEERVLEIGTGSGYQTAVLSELSKRVYSLERFGSLAKRASKILTELGYSSIEIKVGDGTLGWQEFSPYEAIIVTAGAPKVPAPLIEQLKENGRLVIPIGGSFSQVLTLIKKVKGKQGKSGGR